MADATQSAPHTPSLLERMDGQSDAQAQPSLLSRVESSLALRISDKAPSVSERGGDTRKQPKIDSATAKLLATIPNPADYAPGLEFLRKDATETAEITSIQQLRYPRTIDETRRLAAEAQRVGTKLARQYWGLFKRDANTRAVLGPAADAARLMKWRNPDRARASTGGEPPQIIAAFPELTSIPNSIVEPGERIDEVPPFATRFESRWRQFLQQHPTFRVPGVPRDDEGSIRAGNEGTLTGFLRIMELGPAPNYGIVMRDWMRCVLEADYRDSALLERIGTLRTTKKFPANLDLSQSSAHQFLESLAVPGAGQDSLRVDSNPDAVYSWTYHLLLQLPERFEISTRTMDCLFGTPPADMVKAEDPMIPT